MALRMCQMLCTSKEVRRSGAVLKKALTANREELAETEAFAAGGEASWGIEAPTWETTSSTASIPLPRLEVEEKIYQELVATAGEIFAAAARGSAPEEKRLIATLRQVSTQLREGDGLLAEIVRHHHKEGRSWPQRAANTAVLAMRLGLEIGYDERRCLALGLCALMHDLGMTRIPEEVLEAPRLSPEQLELLRRHPIESQKMITAFGAAFAWIGKIAVQVHERHDGSGYPYGLRGEQIHEMARIIGLADAYEAMAHPRPDRKARVTYHALKEIIDLRNTLFERRLIKALIHIVSIFPLGSLVKLNNGEIGRVIGTNRLHPTRPILEILLDPRGRRLETPRWLNLEEEPMLYIVDPAIEEGVLEGEGISHAE